jgi:hypothetical protein
LEPAAGPSDPTSRERRRQATEPSQLKRIEERYEHLEHAPPDACVAA